MKIKVSRNKGLYARFRKLKLYLDDKYLSEIKAGESMIIDIPLNVKKIREVAADTDLILVKGL